MPHTRLDSNGSPQSHRIGARAAVALLWLFGALCSAGTAWAQDAARYDVHLGQAATAHAAAADTPVEKPGAGAEEQGWLTKERKVLLLNGGVAAGILVYGAMNWEYFQSDMKFTSEGWFGRTTRSGGADKLGHLWSAYAASHLLAWIYRQWGYDDSPANDLGALSGLGLQTLIELGDSYSGRYGFSYEDMVMNVIGAGTAWVLGRNPELNRMIDLRVAYVPDGLSEVGGDHFTDYENQRYLLALKLSAFETLRDTPLGWLELHAGYFTRNYEGFTPGAPDNRQRSLYVGIGFDVTRLVRRLTNSDFALFDYVQAPYTSVRVSRTLD